MFERRRASVVAGDARELRVRNLAFISATTAGSGKADAINVAADRILLDGFRRDEFTGIGANTQALESAGRGGTVNVLTQCLAILRGAGVSA